MRRLFLLLLALTFWPAAASAQAGSADESGLRERIYAIVNDIVDRGGRPPGGFSA